MDKTTEFTVGMLAAVFSLFGWVLFSIVRRAWRKRRSIFGRSALFRYTICAVLIVVACYSVVDCLDSIKDGKILVAFSGRWTSGVSFTIRRVENPAGFWEAVCVYSYISLAFFYLSVAEISIGIRQSKRVPGKTSA
jgi:hypothetical protein